MKCSGIILIFPVIYMHYNLFLSRDPLRHQKVELDVKNFLHEIHTDRTFLGNVRKVVFGVWRLFRLHQIVVGIQDVDDLRLLHLHVALEDVLNLLLVADHLYFLHFNWSCGQFLFSQCELVAVQFNFHFLTIR